MEIEKPVATLDALHIRVPGTLPSTHGAQGPGIKRGKIHDGSIEDLCLTFSVNDPYSDQNA